MGTVIAVAAALLFLLWLAIVTRRKALKAYLLASGIETHGSSVLVPAHRGRPAYVAVTYVDSEGVRRSVRKTFLSAGEAQLARKPARVVYHPRRTERDDYVLVAFGDSDRWFRVNFLHT